MLLNKGFANCEISSTEIIRVSFRGVEFRYFTAEARYDPSHPFELSPTISHLASSNYTDALRIAT